jgi:site-specific recombinase XerD
VQGQGFWWSGTSAVPGKTKSSSVLLGDLYQAVVDDYTLNEQRSRRNVEGAWNNHLKAAFAETPVVPFRPSKVKAYVTARKSAGAANATINREIALLKRMCALAVENYEAERADPELIANLMRWAKIKGLDESDNVRQQMFPNELYDPFARECAREGLWFRTMFELIYARGWRPGSLRQLQVKQIDLARRTIRLSGKQTKNKRPVEIGMTDIEYELLRQCVEGKQPDDYVLTRQRDASNRTPKNGGKIVDYRRAWKRVCERVGVKPGREGLIFYDAKRASITNLIDAGIDLKDAMKVTGQLTESAFRRYQQVSLEKLHEVARKIERAQKERQRKARYRQAELFGLEPGRKPS